MTSHATPSQRDAVRTEPPLNIAPVGEMLRLLARAIRAHLLYLENNPTYLKSLENFKASFAPIWVHTGQLLFEISDTQILWEGHPVVTEAEKSVDALPWILYKDGLRELSLSRGVEDQEIVSLVQVIAKVRKGGSDDDLLTLLWEHEFSHIRYRYVDVSFDTAVPIDPAEEQKAKLVDPATMREPAQEQIVPAGVVSMDDFDSTLYFLDENEVQYLQRTIRDHYAADMRQNVVSMLLDVFEQQTDPAIRDEVCLILDGMLVNLLTGGQLRVVASLLREVNIAAGRARDITPTQRELLLSLSNRMSEPSAVAQLLQSLDERTDLPSQVDLNELFEQLRVGALGTIFGWLGRIGTPGVRTLLEAAADRLAAANTSELVRLLGSSEREVALEAVRRSGSLKTAAAVPALARLLQQGEAPMRLAAVTALAEIGTPGAMQHLDRGIDDEDRDVRIAAARALGARNHRQSVQKIEAAMNGKRLQDGDLTEKMAFFESFGSLCGEEGIPMLDGLLNRKGLFGKRGDAELRACAAMALGRIGTDDAFAALRRAGTDKDILVRNAVSKALRGPA
ncbi:MAG TPA: HEAT repeat domain-containing protein [Gemmatimonadaceae bacterium]